MAKLKAPFLSLAARGTLGNSFTVSRHPSGPVAKRVPSHPDAQTLPQLYHRWRFYDANQYWNSLSSADRAVYRDQKYPRHLTPHQKCIRAYLRSPLDLAIHLRFDRPSGQLIPDQSPNANTCTLTGTTPTPGPISRARLFDGIDDKAVVPISPSLASWTQKTVLFWTNLAPFDGTWRFLFWNYNLAVNRGNQLQSYSNSNTARWLAWASGGPQQNLGFSYTPNTWQHHAFTWDGTTATFFLDGASLGSRPLSGTMDCSAADLFLATSAALTVWCDLALDDFRIYTRALTPAHIAYLYQRQRFPQPP